MSRMRKIIYITFLAAVFIVSVSCNKKSEDESSPIDENTDFSNMTGISGNSDVTVLSYVDSQGNIVVIPPPWTDEEGNTVGIDSEGNPLPDPAFTNVPPIPVGSNFSGNSNNAGTAVPGQSDNSPPKSGTSSSGPKITYAPPPTDGTEFAVLSFNGERNGEYLTLEVNIQENPGLILYRIGIQYDKNAVEIIESSDGDRILGDSQSNVFSQNYQSEPYILLAEDIMSESNFEETGCILRLKFKILGSSGTKLSFSAVKGDFAGVDPTSESVLNTYNVPIKYPEPYVMTI